MIGLGLIDSCLPIAFPLPRHDRGWVDFVNTWIELNDDLRFDRLTLSMLQWLATAPERLVIYNRREGERFEAVICADDGFQRAAQLGILKGKA